MCKSYIDKFFKNKIIRCHQPLKQLVMRLYKRQDMEDENKHKKKT